MNIIRIKSKKYERVIKADDGPFIGDTSHMVALYLYAFKDLNTGNIKPEELFTGAYFK